MCMCTYRSLICSEVEVQAYAFLGAWSLIVHVLGCLHTYVLVYLHAHVLVYLHTHVLVYLHTHIHEYSQVYTYFSYACASAFP